MGAVCLLLIACFNSLLAMAGYSRTFGLMAISDEEIRNVVATGFGGSKVDGEVIIGLLDRINALNDRVAQLEATSAAK